MKWINLVAAVTIACAATAANAERITRELLCDSIAQQMMQLAQAIPEIPKAFETTYSNLSPEDQVRFAKVRDNGKLLAEVSKEYKDSFMKACFLD